MAAGGRPAHLSLEDDSPKSFSPPELALQVQNPGKSSLRPVGSASSARPPSSANAGRPPTDQPMILPPGSPGERRGSVVRVRTGSPTNKGSSGHKPSLLPARSRIQLVDSYAAPDSAPNYDVKLARKEISEVQEMMGRAKRSEVTGLISFKGRELSSADGDFSLVDFWTRTSISGLPPQLAKDVYVFRPQPMLYRTWLYHMMYNEGFVLTGSEKDQDDKHKNEIDGMLKHVLSSSCIDAEVSAGRWSPTMAYAPVALGASFAGSMTFTLVACLTLVAIAWITRIMNHPAAYRYSRPATLPLRLAFFVYACITLPGSAGVVFARGLAVVCGLIDFIYGDLMMVLQYRHTCSYSVLRILGQRVYVCRRHGAATSRFYQSRPVVDEYVSGVGAWDSSMVLITDVQGLVMTLEPVTREQWELIMDEAHASMEPIYFLGFDLYNEVRSSAFANDDFSDNSTIEEDEEEKKLTKRDWDSFIRRAEAFIKPGMGRE